ncbi:hypothetical protein LJC36_00250 [Desulfovibrio sp. OttesenSCG-928-C14]|nr:hypothetical protein [Desulfovibrio sp. OttesenSCG-928-C14]
MYDITGTGMRIILIASNLFPAGLTLSEFADDADPFDLPAIQLADKAMGLNGDLITWSSPVPLDVTINVIPDSDDDINLAALAEANRASKGKTPSRDIITMVRIFPGEKPTTLTPGRLTNAVPATSVASSGRKKSKAYTFTFEGKAGA